MLLAKTRVSADLAEWSDRLLPEEINNFSGINPGPTTNIDKLTRKKEKSNSFHLLFPEKCARTSQNENNPYASKCMSPYETWYPNCEMFLF